MGVTMPTPGLARSSQPVMPSGLPGRTTKTTTDCVQMPLVSLSFQSSAHQAGVDQPGDVRLEGEVHLVGVLAGLDRAALVARGAVGRPEGDVVTLVGALEPSMTALLACSRTE